MSSVMSTYNNNENIIDIDVYAKGDGIKETKIEYQVTNDSHYDEQGTWSNIFPTNLEQGKFIWTRNTFIYTDETEFISYNGGYVGKDGKINGLNEINISAADQSIVVTQTGNNLTIGYNNANEYITKDVNNLANYTLKTNTGSSIDLSLDNNTYILTSTLKDINGNILNSKTVDLPLETMVVSGSYDSTNKKIILTLQNGTTIDVPVGDLISGLQTEITSSNKLSSDLVDDTNNTNKFITTSERNTWNNKQDTIIAGTNISIAADGVTISATDTTYSEATTSVAGLMSATDKIKLNKVANNIIVSETEPSTLEDVWIEQSRNLFNYENILSNYFFETNTSAAGYGFPITQPGYYISPQFPVSNGENFCISTNKYDTDFKVFVWDHGTTSFTEYTGNIVNNRYIFEVEINLSGEGYIYFGGNSEFVQDVQFEKGTTPTSLVRYSHRIFIKDKDNIYKQFYPDIPSLEGASSTDWEIYDLRDCLYDYPGLKQQLDGGSLLDNFIDTVGCFYWNPKTKEGKIEGLLSFKNSMINQYLRNNFANMAGTIIGSFPIFDFTNIASGSFISSYTFKYMDKYISGSFENYSGIAPTSPNFYYNTTAITQYPMTGYIGRTLSSGSSSLEIIDIGFFIQTPGQQGTSISLYQFLNQLTNYWPNEYTTDAYQRGGLQISMSFIAQ